jgi:hypothetical protein
MPQCRGAGPNRWGKPRSPRGCGASAARDLLYKKTFFQDLTRVHVCTSLCAKDRVAPCSLSFSPSLYETTTLRLCSFFSVQTKKMMQRTAASKKVPLVRFRSTTVGTSSIVEAKSRVLEHARNISRTSIKNAQPAPNVYVLFSSAIFAPANF